MNQSAASKPPKTNVENLFQISNTNKLKSRNKKWMKIDDGRDWIWSRNGFYKKTGGFMNNRSTSFDELQEEEEEEYNISWKEE